MVLPHFLVSLAVAVSAVSGSAISPRDVYVQRRELAPKPVPDYSMWLARRGNDLLVPIHKRSDLVERAANVNKTIDLSFQRQMVPLFSAEWAYETPRVPIGPLPLSAQVGAKASLTLQCVDCKTYGKIEASLDDPNPFDNNGIKAGLTFHGVGALVDLSLLASGQGTYTIGLGYFAGTGNTTGSFFAANFGANIDLILQVTGEIQATGGFQVSVPEGERVGIDVGFKFALDSINPLDWVDVTGGKIDVVPHTDFYLLPLAVSSASVNITAALRIKIEADVTGTIKVPGDDISLGFALGAHLTLVQAKLGTSFSNDDTCRNSIHADVETNGGAIAQLSAAVGDHGFTVGPSVSTVFFSAGTTKCLATNAPVNTPAFIATKAAVQPVPQAVINGSCPTALTETTTITATYSLTTCAVPEINCPPRFNQVIVAVNTEAVTTTRCKGLTGAAATATATPTVTPASSPAENVRLSNLPAKIVSTQLAYANITVNSTALLKTAAFVSATPPPPPTTAVPTDGSIPTPGSAGQQPGNAGAALRVPAVFGGVVGVVGVALVMLLL